MDTTKLIGTVCAAHDAAGYFFVAVGRRTYFAHITKVVGETRLVIGDKCSFAVGPGHKPGTEQAYDVVVIEEAPAVQQ
jgi:hypothetical protein